MIAGLDALLTALYVELTDRIIPCRGLSRSGPGKPPEVADAELVCLAVAQVLLRYDDERHWLRAAPARMGHLFPRLLGQSEYNARLKSAAPLMEAALRLLAEATPGSAEMLRLMDATPIPCGHSVITARRSDLFGYAGYGYGPLVSRRDVMNTPGKLMALLDATGFRQPRAEIVPWSHQPSPDEFITQHTALGVAGRRLARLDPHARAAFLQSARSRLENLSPEDFIDRSEVITAAAIAR